MHQHVAACVKRSVCMSAWARGQVHGNIPETTMVLHFKFDVEAVWLQPAPLLKDLVLSFFPFLTQAYPLMVGVIV